MDPLKTNDGRPARPIIYKRIVKERYALSKYCHIPYNDTLFITPLERRYLLEFWDQDIQEEKRQKEESEKK